MQHGAALDNECMTAISTARIVSSSFAATSSRPVLRQGSSGTAVRELQQALRNAGHAVDVDGQFGPQTRNAVLAFQRARGLSADGIVGAQTWGALGSVAASSGSGQPTLRQGASGQAVTDLQNKLRAAGLGIAADGQFGPQTRNAVIAFQRSRGLGVDGVVGPQTWAALNSVSTPAPSGGGAGPTLRQGSSGGAVVFLQQKLGIGADGQFGPQTRNAVINFQRARGLTADGIVGPQTWAALGGYSGPAGETVTGYVNGQPRTITLGDIGNGKKARGDVAEKFNAMKAAAAAAGINLHVNSGFRTMAEQQHLYNLYKAGKGNLAAAPGYSNHQGGTSIDINMPGGYNGATYAWLKANGGKYGFVNDVGGEPWHWTYKW